mmetsp:Transcript_25543/g.32953  ORF Transcript_25543/g.32953 Transcript_25543/m.32953 type:complete len:289 (-) Transcript_25543:186-1052(-)
MGGQIMYGQIKILFVLVLLAYYNIQAVMSFRFQQSPSFQISKQGTDPFSSLKMGATSEDQGKVPFILTRRKFGISVFSSCVLANCFTAPAEASDTATIVNAVLSGYGLPNIPEEPGFTKLVQEVQLPNGRGKAIVSFQYPKGWVESRAATRLGASNYQQGDRCLLTVVALPDQYTNSTVFEIPSSLITDKIVPGDINSKDSVFSIIDDVPMSGTKKDSAYRLLVLKFSTVTASGYDIQQYLLASATVIENNLLCFQASCQTPRKKKMAESLQKTVESFKAFGTSLKNV